MYRRDHHRRIDAVLKNFNTDILKQSQCFFGGGTAIVLLLDEYRESVDIDFICSSVEGYRNLRNLVTQQSLGDIMRGPVEYVRDVRADRYGIRTFIRHEGVPIKIEIVSEGRIAIAGTDHPNFPVPLLVRDDMYAEKLLANADRGRDVASMSRDIIDIAMMMQTWGGVPETALAKAKHVYGDSVIKEFNHAVAMVSNPDHLARCLAKMHMDQHLLHHIPQVLGMYPLVRSHRAPEDHPAP